MMVSHSDLRGTATGTAFDDADAFWSHGPVASILIRSGGWLDNIGVKYADGFTVTHGGGGGSPATFDLNYKAGEAITRVDIRAGQYITAIQFTTNFGRQSPFYGTQTGSGPFTLMGRGTQTFGFFSGKSSQYVDQLQLHFVGLPTAPPELGSVSLRGTHGKYLSAEKNMTASVSRTDVLLCEVFSAELLLPDQFALRSHFGKFLSAEDGGKMVVNSASAGPWEHFQVANNGSGVTFKSWQGKYVSTQDNGSTIANRAQAQTWETFVFDRQGWCVSLRTFFNQYWSAQPDGTLQANRTAVGDWEKWTICP